LGDAISPRVGIDPDAVAALRPDLVVTDTRIWVRTPTGTPVPAACPLLGLEKNGILMVCINASVDMVGVTGAQRSILLLGEIVGSSNRAQEIVAGYQQRQKAVLDKVKNLPRVRVLFIRAFALPPRPEDPGVPVREREPLNELIDLAGGVNIFGANPEDKTAVEKLVKDESIDEYLKRNPEVILLRSDPLGMSSRPSWGQLDAVKQGRVYRVGDLTLLSVIDRLEEIARLLHPQVFEARIIYKKP